MESPFLAFTHQRMWHMESRDQFTDQWKRRVMIGRRKRPNFFFSQEIKEKIVAALLEQTINLVKSRRMRFEEKSGECVSRHSMEQTPANCNCTYVNFRSTAFVLWRAILESQPQRSGILAFQSPVGQRVTFTRVPCWICRQTRARRREPLYLPSYRQIDPLVFLALYYFFPLLFNPPPPFPTSTIRSRPL